MSTDFMGIISEACKQRIRERVPLQDLVREYNVHLVPSGRRMKGLCPFHAEKTPSFSVDIERQYYYCFGCQAGGDLFSFVKNLHHVDYPEAVEMLARRAGVPVEYEGGRHPPRERERTVELYDVLALAQDFYHRFLLDDPQARVARDYLKRRGIEPASWERFHLGYSPPDWDAFTRFAARKGIAGQILERAGLARARGSGESPGAGHYDYFRGRVMFPIGDPQGRAIGFGARTLGDDQPKYLNTPKTALFEKSQVLYAMAQARTGIQREGLIAIVEGYTDAIMAHQAGLDYFVASLGTAFTQENARRIGRLASRVLLVFDGDAAGQKASERSLDLLVPENLDVRVYSVRDGKDPCDAILALGGEEFRRRMTSEAVGLFEFKWRRTMERDGVAEAGASLRARALDEFLSLLLKVPNVVARKLHLREFAERVGLREVDLEARLQELGRSSTGPVARERLVARAASAVTAASAITGAAVPAAQSGAAGVGRDGGSRPELATAQAPREAVRGVGAQAAPSLVELAVECLFAMPARAGEIWEQLPTNWFERSPMNELASGIARQLQEGAVSASRLIQELEDPEAQSFLYRVLSRLEDDQGNPTQDYEEVWTRTLRDIVRHCRLERAEALRASMADASARRDTAGLERMRRDYFELLRELKR